MATIDEIFATMTVDESALATDEVLVIDPNTRQIGIPGGELVFGVESDTGAERKYFQAPRYVGNNLDLASCFIRVNYRNANGEVDAYLVQDVVATEDTVRFSWELTRKVTLFKGQVQFVVCACRPGSNGKLLNEWNTTLANGMVLAGLEPDSAVVEAETKDVISQLLALVEAQSANVEAVGVEQVAVVKKAAQDAQADAVAQVEAKGASTLATIPGEYTATVRAVQGAANAIRKKVSGEVIRVDDVSPMEHYPVVKIRGKNLWNMTDITSADGKFTNNGDGTITVHGGEYYCRTAQTLARICPQLRVGDVVKFSIDTTGNAQIYLTNAQILVLNGYSLTITEAMLESYVAFYGASNTDDDYNEPHTINRVQIELGTVATAYTPYIDPTTVTVRRCGKNMVVYPYNEMSKTRQGVTFTVATDGKITVNGTSTGVYLLLVTAADKALYLNKDQTYFFSCVPSGGGYDTYYAYVAEENGETFFDHGSGVEITPTKSGYASITVVIKDGVTVSNVLFKPMLEVSETVTKFEPYTGETQIPSADGTVSGLSAISPTMTLMTDTPGVNIECEYSRDTNVVVNEILEMISALTSGT